MSCAFWTHYYIIGDGADNVAKKKVAELAERPLEIRRACSWAAELVEEGNCLSAINLEIAGFICLTVERYEIDPNASDVYLNLGDGRDHFKTMEYIEGKDDLKDVATLGQPDQTQAQE